MLLEDKCLYPISYVLSTVCRYGGKNDHFGSGGESTVSGLRAGEFGLDIKPLTAENYHVTTHYPESRT
jgi:hypothetical protein